VDLLEPAYLLRVFLIFARIGGLLTTAPFFSHPSILIRLKIFLAVLLAYALVGIIPGELPPYATTTAGILFAVGVEVLTGVTIGFAGQFIFWAVQFFADTIGFQMGLSLAQVYNPADGTNTNPLGRFISLSMLLVFLLLDGHHHVLRALVLSFEHIPLAAANLSNAGPLMLDWMGRLFLTGLRLAAPFLVTFFLVESALGVFARVVPQADLFTLGLPLKLLIGLSVSLLFMQNFFPVIPILISQLLDDLVNLIEALSVVS
jgi:flagellar biosynthetic protein FliR